MTCATCGAPLEAGAHFCSTCGHPVEASLPASPGPVADAPETMPLHAPLHHVMRPPVHEVYIPGPPAARPATPAAALWPLIGLVILGLVVFCSVGAIVTLLSARSRPAPFQPAPPRPFLTATPTSADPPRMSLEDVKILYDDPGSGLVILDVRAADTYAAGHIKGAISFPEADVDQRVSELPRDKLIVAYCQ